MKPIPEIPLHAAIRWLVGFAAILSCIASPLRAQTVATGKATYELSEDIVVTFGGGPGNAKDWIGVYRDGELPGGPASTLWAYVDGTRDGAVGQAEGSVTFAGGLTSPGSYVAYLLLNDGFDILAVATFEVTGTVDPPDLPATVLPQHSAFFPSEPITIAFRDGPGNPLDWIGIYPEGAVPGPQASTVWAYVGGSTTAGAGLTEGSVTFEAGLNLAGTWVAYLLENDGYTILGQATFQVTDPFSPAVRVADRVVPTGQAIAVSFFNTPGNPKDWIGIYRAGQTPGGPSSTLWSYVDGTTAGNAGVFEGTVTFPTGLDEPGEYAVHLLQDDGYTILATETFTVVDATVATLPRVLSIRPAGGSIGQPPIIAYSASITNGSTAVVTSTVRLEVDGQVVGASVVSAEGLTTVAHTNTVLFAPGSTHAYRLTFADNAVPANLFTNEVMVTVADYRNIVLPEPLYFEDFDGVAEGALPVGWEGVTYTDQSLSDFNVDFGNLDSAAFAGWVVVDVDRFNGSFVTYSNPENPPGWGTDYQRVLRSNPLVVVNGQVLDGPLASGRMIFGNSGYRNGASQVMFLQTRDFDLTGRANVHVAFHSLWEQNQDSIAAVEYSVDQGQTWLPVAYYLHGPDIVTGDGGAVDAEATFNTGRGDIARYYDENFEEKGGTYGAFIAAPVSQDLAPFIEARVDDDPVGGKRVELYRLPAADGRSTVRLRFAHAGTDSWYWGIDNLGLYSIAAEVEAPVVSVVREGTVVRVSWSGGPGTVLQQAATLGDPSAWQPVPGATTSPVEMPAGSGSLFFRAATP